MNRLCRTNSAAHLFRSFKRFVMHKYELTYDHQNVPQKELGEAPERIDAHELLMTLKFGRPEGQVIGSKSPKHSLELMRLTNVSVKWL